MVWGLVVSAVRRLKGFRRLRRPFRHDGGHCWTARLPHLSELADNPKTPVRSTLAVYENGTALPQAHSIHAGIRAGGAGRYSHWLESLFFSASDNSDPNSNGRTYTYRTSAELPARFAASDVEAQPVNLLKRDASPEAIERDVDYALSAGSAILTGWFGSADVLRGKRVLEVGPGINFGTILFLAAHGAAPVVADRFLAPWDGDYHPLFYRALRDRIARKHPGLDLRRLSAVIDANGYPAEIIQADPHSLETLTLDDGSIDLIYSNAVVEHLDDFAKAFRQLYRVTRPGGWGFHQVDFRLHDSFDRPLEHLLWSAEEFEAQSRRCLRQNGTRSRRFELSALFEACGFDPVKFGVNLCADEEYFQEFLPRLRRTTESPYCRTPEEELRPLGALFRVRKPGGATIGKRLVWVGRSVGRWFRKKSAF